MSNHLELGSAPYDEECAQVGEDNYDEKSLRECRAYRNQLKRQFNEVTGGHFSIKSFLHDFGLYREVCAVFDDNNEKAVKWAFNIENNLPTNWDNEAKKELKERNNE